MTAPRVRLDLLSSRTAAVGSWPSLNVMLLDGRGTLRRTAAAMSYTLATSDTTVLGAASASGAGPSYVFLAGEVISYVQMIARGPGHAWWRVSAPGYASDRVAITVVPP